MTGVLRGAGRHLRGVLGCTLSVALAACGVVALLPPLVVGLARLLLATAAQWAWRSSLELALGSLLRWSAARGPGEVLLPLGNTTAADITSWVAPEVVSAGPGDLSVAWTWVCLAAAAWRRTRS